jgi:hypothetical protein
LPPRKAVPCARTRACSPTAFSARYRCDAERKQRTKADRAPLPSLRAVYVGLSAGSMVMTPMVGEDFVRWKPPTGGDETLGMVGFSIFPHLDHAMLPENTIADAERWAAGMSVPCYAIDDETAIKVTDGTVEVVSAGHWKLFRDTKIINHPTDNTPENHAKPQRRKGFRSWRLCGFACHTLGCFIFRQSLTP